MPDHDTSGLRAKILTVSDGVVAGEREDTAGPALRLLDHLADHA